MKILLASLTFVASCFIIGNVTAEDCSGIPMPVGASYDRYSPDYGTWSLEGRVIGYSVQEDTSIVPYDCL